MKRITILAAAGALVITPALGAWAAFGATDDSPSHRTAQVRVDDRHHGEPEPGDDHGRHHHRHGADDGVHHRHGADDRAGHQRRGEKEPGDDQGRHDRHGEAEPQDDHGGHQRHGEGEPGDDHGRHHGGDDGGHHGGDDD